MLVSDASQCDLFPKSASCKCYFFDNLGKLSPNLLEVEDGSDRRFNDVLRRRFFRQGFSHHHHHHHSCIISNPCSINVWKFACVVRSKERRRRTNGSIQRRQFSGSLCVFGEFKLLIRLFELIVISYIFTFRNASIYEFCNFWLIVLLFEL